MIDRNTDFTTSDTKDCQRGGITHYACPCNLDYQRNLERENARYLQDLEHFFPVVEAALLWKASAGNVYGAERLYKALDAYARREALRPAPSPATGNCQTILDGSNSLESGGIESPATGEVET